MGHPDISQQAVAHEQRIVGGKGQAVQERRRHVARGLAHDRLRSSPGACFDGGEHRRAVRQIAIRIRAERVRVGRHDPGAGPDRSEGGEQFRVIEGAVPGDDHDIDVDSDRQLWAESYKGKLADVFDIQEQVSKQIVDALMVKLTPTEKIVLTKRSTVNAEAFDCYLRARDFLYRRTKNGIQFAIQLFKKATELDPRYAAAYAGLGEAYATLHYDYDTKDTWIEKAIESCLRGLMYDPTLSEAYAALGFAYMSRKAVDEALSAG